MGGLPLLHLNLVVADVDRSLAFYRRWFGFDRPPRRYPDGTVFTGNEQGFDLAVHPGEPPRPPAPTVHVGFRAGTAATVRALLEELRSAGVTVTEAADESDYVGLKCLDPDGYEVEVYWEPLS